MVRPHKTGKQMELKSSECGKSAGGRGTSSPQHIALNPQQYGIGIRGISDPRRIIGAPDPAYKGLRGCPAGIWSRMCKTTRNKIYAQYSQRAEGGNTCLSYRPLRVKRGLPPFCFVGLMYLE